MKNSIVSLPAKLAALLIVLAPATSEAARAWLLPSQTIVARSGGWVTVDAAMADDLFSFNQGAMQIDALSVSRSRWTAGRAAESGERQNPQQLRPGTAPGRHVSHRRRGKHGDGALGRRRQAETLARHARGNGHRHSRECGQARGRADAAARGNLRDRGHAHRREARRRRRASSSSPFSIRTICMRAKRRSFASCSTANPPRISKSRSSPAARDTATHPKR